MNTITIELGENTHKLLTHIDSTLTELLKEVRIVSDTAELIRLAIAEGKTPAAAPAVAADQPEPEAEPTIEEEASMESEPEEPQVYKVSLADIQKKVVGLSTKGKKDAVKAIIQAYAPKVSALPEGKLEEIMDKLVELEG